MIMGGYLRPWRQPVDMAATERPTFGMRHPTVVPTNFESGGDASEAEAVDVSASDREADAEAVDGDADASDADTVDGEATGDGPRR